MGRLKVVTPGLLTTVQDVGRPKFQQSGMGVSGVMDRYSQRCANLLVGNAPDEAVLEATLLGPALEFRGESVIAVTGGAVQPQLNGQPVAMWQSLRVKQGDILSFTMLQKGCRLYIAFAGGIDVPVVMGSKSTNLKARVGGLDGRALRKEDELSLNAAGVDVSKLPLYRLPQEFIPELRSELELRVVLGPQDDAFTRQGLDTFLSGVYAVTQESDRMGYRLEGEAIEHRQGSDIISDGIVMGAVQVPGNGKPIILLADRQTTGGYTKIATVISADLPKLGQARPGDQIRFREISVQEAQSCLNAMERQIATMQQQLIAVESAAPPPPDEPGRRFVVWVDGQSFDVSVQELS